MNNNLKETLKSLATKYEVCSFCDEDPSQFLRWYDPSVSANIPDVEAASFIAAMLAFGNRKQFIPKITYILNMADSSCGSITKWLLSDCYKKDFPSGANKFYRFYSFDDMISFFGDLRGLVGEAGSLGKALELRYEEALAGQVSEGAEATAKNAASGNQLILLADVVSAAFPNSKIVPKGKNTANKRIHMFLRWMVRQNSPVDLGLWSWYSPADLLIPLDVHVMEEGIRLGALPENARATRKTAIALTESLKEIWPSDPCRGDFALFGLGVDTE